MLLKYLNQSVRFKLKSDKINWKTLRKALSETSKKRGSEKIIANYKKILETLKTDNSQLEYWNKYSAKTPFAKGITYNQTLEMIEQCFSKLC